jgi:hypothetical protein
MKYQLSGLAFLSNSVVGLLHQKHCSDEYTHIGLFNLNFGAEKPFMVNTQGGRHCTTARAANP